ncbi:MAG: branched-chain amino acid transporter, permease [Acidimicrobiaceae bacterium]|nr:branched-chain amino acid transporter, permease [Acidimicrobiaceae bacterium]
MTTANLLIANTIVLGSLYALMGIGFVTLFRSTGVVNFAQGSFMVVGAYALYSCTASLHLPFFVAFVIAVLIVSAIGAVVYAAFLHRLTGADLFVTVIATLGLSIVVQTATSMIWGANERPLPVFFRAGTFFSIFGVQFTRVDALAVIASIALIACFELVLQRTSLGVQTRAVADSTQLAALMKVRVHAVSAMAWAISSLCAAIAGIAIALQVGAVDPVSVGQVGLLVFPVVIVGGVDSLKGAMAGGVLIAAIQNLVLQYLGGSWVDPMAYAALLLMLLLRPTGLFGSRAVIRI